MIERLDLKLADTRTGELLLIKQKINELIDQRQKERLGSGTLSLRKPDKPMGMTYEGISKLKTYYSMWTGRDPTKVVEEWKELEDQVLRVPPGVEVIPLSKPES